MIKISVIVPVKNGSKTLEKCLTSLFNQSIFSQIEIILLDSSSSDKSVEIAQRYGVKVISIDALAFNHGLTRHLGAHFASGKLLYFTVQDAVMSDTHILENMSKHFIDIEVQAVVGIQGIPSSNANNPALWFNRVTPPELEIRHFPDKSFSHLSLKNQFELSNWDNVNAMYRKEALIKIPFKKTDFSEDWLWANEALRSGMKIIRDPSLLVYHYHYMSFSYVFRSIFIMNYNFYKNFSYLPSFKMSFLPLVKRIYTIFKRDNIKLSQKIFWILHNITYEFGTFFSNLLFHMSLTFGGNRIHSKIYLLLSKKIPVGRIK